MGSHNEMHSSKGHTLWPRSSALQCVSLSMPSSTLCILEQQPVLPDSKVAYAYFLAQKHSTLFEYVCINV